MITEMQLQALEDDATYIGSLSEGSSYVSMVNPCKVQQLAAAYLQMRRAPPEVMRVLSQGGYDAVYHPANPEEGEPPLLTLTENLQVAIAMGTEGWFYHVEWCSSSDAYIVDTRRHLRTPLEVWAAVRELEKEHRR